MVLTRRTLPVLLGLTLQAIVGPRATAITKLPHYITACSRSDPKINECVVKNGRHALPFVVNGDPKYRVPNMNPMVIPEMALHQGSEAAGLRLKWKNAELHGLRAAEMVGANMDVKGQHLKMDFFLPKFSITGTYTAGGRILLLPITGTGPSNITVHNMTTSYEFDWKVYKKGNGREYIDVVNPKMTLHDIAFMIMKFENLFSGDGLLGSTINQFLNDNWKELVKEFGPGIADAIGQVFQLVIKNICDVVPYDLLLKM